MAKSKTNKPAYEIGDFSGTGYGLVSVRALDKADPSRGCPVLPLDAEYAAQLAYQDRRAAILDDAHKRNVMFSMDLLMVNDLDVLAEKLGCIDATLHIGDVDGTTYPLHYSKMPRKTDNENTESETSGSHPQVASPLTYPVSLDSSRVRRSDLLADANSRGVRLGLNEAMTDDLDELERIVETRG